VNEAVRRAFQGEPVSHRSDSLMADFRSTRRMLCELTGARDVQLLLGSGSLANDAVCAQISLLHQPGLIVSGGEFGERLIDHATRQGLAFEVYRTPWGNPPDLGEIRRLVAREPRPRWLWTPHCETSTGILMDLAALQRICAEHEVKLCLDGISSIGTLPVDLGGVYLASCVSGKALAAFPGLSMVFHNHDLAPAPGLPRYLDLGAYAEASGMPFTQSSNLIQALQTALAGTDWPAKHRRIAETGAWLRRRLVEAGLEVVAPEAHAAPAVVSIRLPEGVSSKAVGDQLAGEGCLLSYNSGYLLRRNWIQICLMGRWPDEHLRVLPDRLAELAAPPGA
jgi:aspartate aminotransferase-like enzyme